MSLYIHLFYGQPYLLAMLRQSIQQVYCMRDFRMPSAQMPLVGLLYIALCPIENIIIAPNQQPFSVHLFMILNCYRGPTSRTPFLHNGGNTFLPNQGKNLNPAATGHEK